MKELDLYKFINDNNIEWHRRDNEGKMDIVIFPMFFQMDSFRAILTPCIFDDDGLDCVVKDGYIAIWMNDICEYYDVDMDACFDKSEGD